MIARGVGAGAPATLDGRPVAHRFGRAWHQPRLREPHYELCARLIEASARRLALFHGLEGSSGSHYARSLMAHIATLGWSGAVPHFRGCSGEPNRLPRAYATGCVEIRLLSSALPRGASSA